MDIPSDHPRTPALASPPRTSTPPLQSDRTGNRSNANIGNASEHQKGSRAVNPDQLTRALQNVEGGARQTDRTPAGSPTRKRQRVYGDRWVASESLDSTKPDMLISRFIPNRDGQDLQASFSLLHDDGSPATPTKAKKRTPHGDLHFQRSTCLFVFPILL